jgi:hypothetical protein
VSSLEHSESTIPELERESIVETVLVRLIADAIVVDPTYS